MRVCVRGSLDEIIVVAYRRSVPFLGLNYRGDRQGFGSSYPYSCLNLGKCEFYQHFQSISRSAMKISYDTVCSDENPGVGAH